MKILSIDWDYFFPDTMPYDWGHKENMFFLETIWPIRLTNRNLITGEDALSNFKPTIPKDFWKRVVTNNPVIFVAESHASILALPFRKAIITNLDAHHDCGYGRTTEIECGNWAMDESRIPEYHLCYPTWRKIGAEGIPQRQPDSIINGLPEPSEYNIVFVCRSGCWTPPWYDARFKSFLKQSGFQTEYLDKLAGRVRAPNMKQAKILKLQMDKQFKFLERKVA